MRTTLRDIKFRGGEDGDYESVRPLLKRPGAPSRCAFLGICSLSFRVDRCRAGIINNHQENLESDSMKLCAIDALRGTFVHSIRFQVVRSDSTRAFFFMNVLPLKRSVHGRASKHSPKVLSSVSLSKLVPIPSTRVIHSV